MITRQELAEQVRDLVGEDRLEDALRLFTEHRGMHNLRNDVAMLAGRLERLRRQERLQTEGFDELNREQNRIREAILELASDMESGSAIPVLSKTSSLARYAIIVIGVLLLSAGTAYIIVSSPGKKSARESHIEDPGEAKDTTVHDTTGEQSPGQGDDAGAAVSPKNDTVVVASSEDFIRALRPGTIQKIIYAIYLNGVAGSMQQSEYINYEKSNSSELELNGLDSVTFIGPTAFYSSDLNSDILNLKNCSNITFRDITFRHTDGSAGIGSEIDPGPAFTLNLSGCTNITFENCHFMGKAVDFNQQNDALRFSDCKQLMFQDCTFENYMGFIAAGAGSNGVFFRSTEFNMCLAGHQTGFMLKGVNRAIFSNCTMKSLQYDQMFSIDRQLMIGSTNFDGVFYKSFAPGQTRHLNFDEYVIINKKHVTAQNVMEIDSWGKP